MTDISSRLRAALAFWPHPGAQQALATDTQDNWDFNDGAKWQHARTVKLVDAIVDCVDALRYRRMHDDDCAEASEEFNCDEMCECGASLVDPAIARVEAALKEMEK